MMGGQRSFLISNIIWIWCSIFWASVILHFLSVLTITTRSKFVSDRYFELSIHQMVILSVFIITGWVRMFGECLGPVFLRFIYYLLILATHNESTFPGTCDQSCILIRCVLNSQSGFFVVLNCQSSCRWALYLKNSISFICFCLNLPQGQESTWQMTIWRWSFLNQVIDWPSMSKTSIIYARFRYQTDLTISVQFEFFCLINIFSYWWGSTIHTAHNCNQSQ